MAIEVEQKFPLDDMAAVEHELKELGTRLGKSQAQVDCYFAHPQRDFAETDEAFRLRRVGALTYLTFKGPKLDATSKTRQEIEVPLASGDQPASDAAELFEALGFRRVLEVRKDRRNASLEWQGFKVEVALDHVVDLGDFVELEITADEQSRDDALSSLNALAKRLNLSKSERRSYLELLLEHQAQHEGEG